jgi:single-strand DNA-binding protein
MGNLTKDPELRYTPSGAAICSISVALNEKWKGKDGEWVEKVHYIDCNVFGRRAEVVNEYFTKGKPIYLECSVDFQSWETNEGEKRYATKFKVQDFQFIGGRDDQGSNARGSSSAAPSFPDDRPDVSEEEIPF